MSEGPFRDDVEAAAELAAAVERERAQRAAALARERAGVQRAAALPASVEAMFKEDIASWRSCMIFFFVSGALVVAIVVAYDGGYLMLGPPAGAGLFILGCAFRMRRARGYQTAILNAPDAPRIIPHEATEPESAVASFSEEQGAMRDPAELSA